MKPVARNRIRLVQRNTQLQSIRQRRVIVYTSISLLFISGIVILFNVFNSENVKAVVNTVTWTNGHGTNVWNDPLNWNTGALPGSADIAAFSSTASNCSVNSNVNVAGIAISGSYSGTITQQNGNNITIGSSGFSQTCATFTGGNSAIDINSGTFSLSGGTFNSTSGILYVGGNQSASQTLFTHSGGTFNSNNGSLVIDPAVNSWAGSPTFTLDVLNSTSFYNITLNASTCCNTAIIATASGDTVKASNNLTHADGFISGIFEFKNDLTINANTDGGSGTIIADGTGTQLYYTTGTHRTCHLYVDKSSGTFGPGGSTSNLYTQRFTLANGTFTAPTGNLAAGGTWGTNQTLFTQSGGTFVSNSGTVLIDPAVNSWTGSPTFTLDVIPATSFYNVNLNASTCCNTTIIATAVGDTVKSTNNFTHTDGFISGIFEFKNDLNIAANTDGGSGTLIADGTGTQLYNTTGTHRTCHVYVDKPSGTFGPGASTTNLFTQKFTLAIGTFTAPTGNLAVGGTWGSNQTLFIQTGGTFVSNNGTVLIDPAVNSWTGSPTFTMDVLSSTSFYNVNLNASTCCNTTIIATAAGDTVKSTNNFTHTDGFISGIFEFKNDLNIAANTDGGSGTIIADGTGTQLFNTTGTHRTCHVYVDKPSGTFGPGASTTNLYTQKFTLANGTFIAPTGNLAAGGAWGSNQTLFTHSGGIFNSNSGTVLIDPAVNSWTGSPTFTLDVIIATSLYNINLNASTCCNTAIIATATGDTVKSTNNLTHTDGFISGIFEFKNDLNIAANTDGGSGVIIADGTGAQQFNTTGTHRTCHLYVDKPSGTFGPGAATTDLYTQKFTLANGTFTAPTGNLATGGAWGTNQTLFTHSGGTFISSTGTVLIDPVVNSWVGSPTFTLDVIGSTSLYNINLNASTCCNTATIATAAGDTIKSTNNLTHTDGFIAGIFELKNNLNIAANSDGGTGTIVVDGTGTQTYSSTGTARTCHVYIDKSSGSFAPAAGTSSFYVQRFSLINGNFTAPSGNFNIGGTWGVNQTLFMQSGGNYIHNNGTLVINPNVNTWIGSPTYTLDVLPATSFYNVSINASTCCNVATVATAANDTIEASNSLNYIDGKSTAIIEAGGNVTVASTFDGGTGKLIFTGSNDQNFDLSGATGLFDNDIVLNKTSGKVYLQSACILDGATQRMTFTKGIFVSTSTNLLTYGDNFIVSGASDSSFIQGPVSKIGNDLFIFPVGAGNNTYAPLRISAPSTVASQFTAEYIHADPNSLYNRSSKDPTLVNISSCEYWTLNRIAGSSSVTVTLSWNSPRSCGVSVPAELTVARWDGSTWRDNGNGGVTITGASGTLPSNAPTGNFGPFTLGSSTGNNALPIELVSFEAKYNKGVVNLKWVTASEQNNDYFTLEKSRDLVEITELKKVDGAGNSLNALTYNDIDENPFSGKSYYRLKQTDFDGKFSYSRWVNVVTEAVDAKSMVKVYPNPCDGININLEITNLENTEISILLSDLSGKNIFSKTIMTESDHEIQQLGQPQQLLPGTYVLSIIADENKFGYKLVVK